MRGQTSLEYLLIVSGVLVIALAAGYYLVSAAASNVPAAPQSPPSPTLSVDPSAPTTSVPVSITCSASGAQVVRIYIDANLTRTCSASPCTYQTTFSSPGTHNAACEAVFQEGTRWTATYFDVTGSAPPSSSPPPSGTPPTVTISTNGTSFTAPASVDVSLTASDDTALSSVSLDCGNGQTNTWTSPSNPFSTTYTCNYPSAGTYTITATATDNLGQQSSDSVTVFVQTTTGVDNLPPVVSILSPSDGAVFNVTSVDVSFEAYDNNTLESVSVDCDYPGVSEYTFAPNASSYSDTVTCSYTSDGEYSIYVGARDFAGNQGFDTVTITVDTTPPDVSLSVTPTSGTESDTFTISCSATDATSGISSIVLSVDGSEANTCTSSPCTYSGQFPAGTHTVDCQATDNAGNTGADTASFTVTASGVSVSLSLSPEEANESVPITLTCSASSASPITSIRISLDGSVVAQCADTDTCTYTNYVSGGSHDAQCVARDSAGDTGVDWLSFVVDAKPTVTSLTVDPQQVGLNQRVTLSCSAVDDRGLSEIVLQIPGLEYTYTCDYTAQGYPLTATCTVDVYPARTGTFEIYCYTWDTASQADTETNTLVVS